MLAEILVTLPRSLLDNVEVLLVLAITALIGVALYSTFPEWR